MKRIPWLLVIVALSLTGMCPFVHAADKTDDKLSAAAKEVEKAYRDYLDASVKKDEKAMLALLAEDYSFTDNRGKMLSRIGLIGFLVQPDIKLDPYIVADLKVRVYGDAAILTVRITEKGKRDGFTVNTPLQSTVTLVKKDGRWVLVAEHLSALPN